MPAIGFKKEFIDLIKNGEKKQTIRQVWKNPVKKNDMLYLYAGLRTKYCKKIGDSWCNDLADIRITKFNGVPIIELNGVRLNEDELLSFVVKDGFDNAKDFIGFFERQYSLPFNGVVIYWGFLEQGNAPKFYCRDIEKNATNNYGKDS